MIADHPFLACYYFPNYHADARNAGVHGPGWTEWEVLKAARPRWRGHRQPRAPRWGYTDEADPRAMERKIAAAAGHRIDAFVFDWYWYEDGPFLQRALDEGFLRARNRERLKFALMWANHDWTDIHPQKLRENPRVLYPGALSARGFERLTDKVVRDYFSRPNYWRIAGAPYFSIYDLAAFIRGLGGIEPAIAALRRFREKTRRAGHRDLHLNIVYWQRGLLAGEKALPVTAAFLRRLGADSTTSYVWIHHVPLRSFPTTSYAWVFARYREYLDATARRFAGLPHYPNVTMGWDSSPRTVSSDRFLRGEYPFLPALSGNTPAAFRRALSAMKGWLAGRPPGQRILTLNAWNEWTEGSYLEPDTEHGYGYLEAVREVFGPPVP
ncbi:MAG: hypothetical protein FJ399_01575 [Verrucomicrobia bacterium]|nr:hypothetical protein [Verrucomicrobiota bacterium]